MIKLTDEQNQIIKTDLAPGEILKVIAFAGAGKTSTLVEYTRRRPDMRFLYIAFNKGVQKEAQRKFPSHVFCRTSHALGFRAKGVQHKNRLVPGFKANIVKEVLELDTYEEARFTIDTLNRYLVSPDAKVSGDHIPFAAKTFFREKKRNLPDLVSHANRLGRLMCKGSDERIGMLHDGYLKLYQLSSPVLDYDCILLDEAQDINPVTRDIIFRQSGSLNRPGHPASIILVGDSHQQIYSFRGANDTLKNIRAAKTLFLTQSFRFDSNIARIANMVLEVFKGEDKKLRGTPYKKAKKPKWNPKKHTIIARTNATLFKKAARLCTRNRIGFVGGIQGYKFDSIKDVHNLYSEKPVFNGYIRSFGSYANLKSYALDVEDLELLSICAVVEEYEKSIPGLIRKIMEKAVDAPGADILLTTAHKAKGLEWDDVLMMDDFQNLVHKGGFTNPSLADPDEYNLIYVAMTRAMKNLRFDSNNDVPEFIRLYRGLPGK
ncbi:UvrD-helicase domain-containing protein [Desulfospira joergensenii]|uniref:UvrD-helicase domain-containing protein n=1 Tax=Desulfospira joergensenii TaxID=53329 RepID=UPI0003B32E52|nr:UvrD-helicase domain-containing protein [Desulfospira joergensenii]